MRSYLICCLVSFGIACHPGSPEPTSKISLQEVNASEIPAGTQTLVISDVRIVDGKGNPPIEGGVVVVEANKILAVGEKGRVEVPANAKIIDGKGKTVLPGLIDAHFHLDNLKGWPNMFLKNGITSVRDPGAWIEAYEEEREKYENLPRLFLTGPHLDMPPPAYPKNSYVILDRKEARDAVNAFADQGASAIKIYFRVSLGLIEEVCDAAHQRGIPVTAHLEITDARAAIEAGLDGIEHITSFGTTLTPRLEAETYRQKMLADNNARRQGRYEVWEKIDLESEKTADLIAFIKERGTFVCPTLGAFEYRFSEEKQDSVRIRGFQKMLDFTGQLYQGGGTLVVGSHSWIPYAGPGWSFHHEMALLAEAGMPTLEIIRAGTWDNARFFRIEDRLGSLEPGKLADLLIVDGNPVEDIRAIRNIHTVIQNGRVVE